MARDYRLAYNHTGYLPERLHSGFHLILSVFVIGSPPEPNKILGHVSGLAANPALKPKEK